MNTWKYYVALNNIDTITYHHHSTSVTDMSTYAFLSIKPEDNVRTKPFFMMIISTGSVISKKRAAFYLNRRKSVECIYISRSILVKIYISEQSIYSLITNTWIDYIAQIRTLYEVVQTPHFCGFTKTTTSTQHLAWRKPFIKLISKCNYLWALLLWILWGDF